MDKPIELPIIGGTFTTPSYATVSAQAQGMALEWCVAVGKRHDIWLYHPERSGVWCDGGPGSRGCGGATVKFKLAKGLGFIELVGPWHSNADAFFQDTGIDVREKFVTWGCIGTGRAYDANTSRNQITDVVYFDKEPTVGAFDRIDMLAWEMLEKDPSTLLYSYRESEGGSSFGLVGMPYRVRVAKGLQKEWDGL